jgi:molybdate transport system ATP-binding protein
LVSPRLLLMDEPVAAPDEARETRDLPYVERLRDERAIPIVYLSHRLSELERLTLHIVRLDHGRIVPEDTADG